MRLAPLLCLLALLPLVAAVPIPYSNCGSPSDHIRITKAEADVWPPVSGRPLTVTLSGVLDEQVDSGNYAIQVLYNQFPIINKKGPLSDLPNVTFPIAAGPVEMVRTLTIPSIGKAAITVNASATDHKGERLLCIGFVMNLNANPAEKGLLTPDELWQAIQPQQQTTPTQVDESEEEEDAAEEEMSLFDSEPSAAVVAVRRSIRSRVRPSLKAALSGLMRFAAAEVERFAESLQEEEEAAAVVNVPFINCGSTASDLVSIKSLTSTAWPPAAGSEAVVTIGMLVNQKVNDGAFVALLSIDGFQLVNSTGPLSSFGTMPIPQGPLNITRSVALPPSIPFSGMVDLQLSAANDLGQQLFCLALTFAL